MGRVSDEIPLIRADAFAAMPAFIDSRNIGLNRLRSASDVPLDVLAAGRGYIPIQLAGQLLASIARVSGDEVLGVSFARFAGPAMLLELGEALRGKPTLGALINAAGRLIQYHTQGVRMCCTPRGKWMFWSYALPAEVRVGREFGHQLSLVMMLDLMQLALGPRWLPQAVLFEQPPPTRIAGLEETFGPRLGFGAHTSGILFDAGLLAHPLPQPPAFTAADHTRINGLLEQNAPAPDLRDGLAQVIVSLLPHGAAGLERLAAACGMSARTLQRRLVRKGIYYSLLVDDVRLDEARRRLADPEVKMIEIAMDLGYSDAANFTHAFRRWTGVSPSDFRRQHSGASGAAIAPSMTDAPPGGRPGATGCAA